MTETAVPPGAGDPTDRRPSKRPKGPGATVLALTFGLAMLVAITGITSRVAPPPTVAQFAPQAVQQIKKAPKDQSSRFGSGSEGTGSDGQTKGQGGGGGQVSATAPARASVPPLPTSAVPVTHRCVGDPPRQIEDSQSPPCVAFWQGQNGGATWKGVTADEIRIAVPNSSACRRESACSTNDVTGQIPALQNFFNNRFEFYGRKLVLFDPKVSQSDAPEAERNDAASVDSQRAFASLGYSYNHYYAQELARRKIISVTSEPYYTEADLKGSAPYIWQYELGLDEQFANQGAWICNRMAGRKASHAGDPTYHPQTRKFGIVSYNTFPELPIDLGPLKKRMEGCGATPAVIIDKVSVGNAYDPTVAQNTALKMKEAGVTSVVCTCNFLQMSVLMRGSTAQRYFPEWLTGTYFFNDSDYAIHSFNADANQLDHMVGLTFQPRELRPENTPALWAVKEGSGRPSTANEQTSAAMYNLRGLYHELLLVASGIQMAGPLLTPTTFEAGLMRSVFPNPDHPTKQGVANFLGDHSMTDDGAEYYWDNRATSPYSDNVGQGAFCYIDSGRRHTIETWPKGEPPFGQFPCDSRSQ